MSLSDEESRELSDLYQKLCLTIAGIVTEIEAATKVVQSLQQGALKTVKETCDIGSKLISIMEKDVAKPDDETQDQPIRLILPLSERRETFIDTSKIRGMHGTAPKETPRQDNRQGSGEEAPGDHGSTD